GFAEPEVQQLVDRFREIYPDVVIPATTPMPGADQALRAVRDAGGRVLVVTGKYQPNAALHLEALGWEVDRLAGDVFASAKGTVLREEGATIYVGDHLGDVRGAHAAGARSVAVATGPHSAAELAPAGADEVLADLTGFPAWLADDLNAAGRACSRPPRRRSAPTGTAGRPGSATVEDLASPARTARKSPRQPPGPARTAPRQPAAQ